MSIDWVQDLHDMHAKFGFHDWVREKIEENDTNSLKEMLEFRYRFLQEELNEMRDGIDSNSPEDIVDSLIDLCVVAIGTLDLYDIKSHKAWDNVHTANMSKERGIKPNRPNPLGLPDLLKPNGWVGPEHKNNHGILKYVFGDML